MAQTVRYRYRVYPDAEQCTALARAFGCARVVFNDFVRARRDAHEQGLPFEKTGDLVKRLTTLAKDTPERAYLAEVSSVVLQQSLRDANKAYRNFFDSVAGKRKGPKVNPPRFKSRRDNKQSIRFTNNAGYKIRQVNTGKALLRLPAVPGEIKVSYSRPLPSAPSSVTIIKEPDGRYYASFTVTVDKPEPLPKTDVHAGVDMGLETFAAVVQSNGERDKIPNPRHYRAAAKKLARVQRAHARREKGSKNREKARVLVAAQHRKVREKRTDHAHKTALAMIRENQTVAVETLNVRGLARSGASNAQGRGLRKSIHDAAWGSFLKILTEKATRLGRSVLPEDPAYSSQTCSVCGTLDGPKPLTVREWTCPQCLTLLERDYNAAVNILVAAGQAETVNACGGDVRRALASAVPANPPVGRKEAGTTRRARVSMAAPAA